MKYKGINEEKCEEIRERMPDLASGLMEATPEMGQHLAGCSACTEKLNQFRQTMALLDEWTVPEPSPYFDVRLQARLREEMARPQASWMAWFRRPVLATALTVLMGVGVGLFLTNDSGMHRPGGEVASVMQPPSVPEPGSAVSDLQSLENNHDLYNDFDLLDDLQVQHDVVANP